jgi:hypothetical protein
MFWPVLRRCHILRWDWSVLPLAHHSIFPFENFGSCWFLDVSTILWFTHRDCRIFIVRAWCSECVHTLDLGLSSHPKDVRWYDRWQQSSSPCFLVPMTAAVMTMMMITAVMNEWYYDDIDNNNDKLKTNHDFACKEYFLY